MTVRDPNSKRRLRGIHPLHWLVLGICLTATYFFRQAALEDAYLGQAREFEFQTREFKLVLEQRLESYRQILQSAAGLFAASDNVGRDEFHVFIENLQIAKNYPGVEGISFIQIVLPEEKKRHLETLRRQGFPGYRIYPEGERNPYTTILYIEPFSGRNLRAFGYDAYSDPVRRAAMQRARDTGAAAISGKVRLVQETEQQGQAGFLMFIPIYANHKPNQTLEERRANITGWVYAAFRMNDLLAGIFGSGSADIGLTIYDGEQPVPEALMFENNPGLLLKHSPHHHVSQAATIQGRHWTLRFYSEPVFEAKTQTTRANDITLAGALTSALLTALIWQLIHVRTRALTLAGQITHDLKESEARTKAALAEVQNQKFALDEHAIVARTDIRGTITYVNKLFCEISGYSREELIGQNHRLLNSGFHPKEFFTGMFKTITAGKVWRGEICNKAKDGRLYWVLTTIVPFMDDKGKPAEYIALRSDITERKDAEQRVTEANRFLQDVLDDLEKSEAKLRSLFELSPVGIALTDMQGRYLEFNRAFCQICGYEEDELKSLDYWDLTPREYYEKEQEQLQLMMETGRYGPYEKEYRRKDGSLIPLRFNGVLVTDKDNKQFIWSIVEDISISKEIEDNLRQAKLAAEQANKAKSEFVATASHELRTPLTSIQGSIDLLLGGVGGELPETSLKLLAIAGNNCKRLIRLISEMLNLEKLEADKLVLTIKAIDIIPLIEEIIQSNRAIADNLKLSFAFSHEQESLFVLADSDAFIQAVTNLISNALKFSYPESKILIEARAAKDTMRLSVTNDGAGIQESFRDRIFEKFSQEDASNSRQKGGTGLGLSITKALIEKMGGTIGFASEPDKQTTFFFDLPLAPAQHLKLATPA